MPFFTRLEKECEAVFLPTDIIEDRSSIFDHRSSTIDHRRLMIGDIWIPWDLREVPWDPGVGSPGDLDLKDLSVGPH